MFSEMTTKYVNGAIGSETTEAVKNYGANYNSLHEGFAVLKEEVDEARDEQIHIRNGLFNGWEAIKHDDKETVKKHVQAIREHAEKLALEAVQVCAVCNKILDSI